MEGIPQYPFPQTVFGVESELAVYPVASGPEMLEHTAPALMEQLQLGRGHHNSGYLLPTGGLVYIDSGDHLEMCTPECADPKDFVAYNDWGMELTQDICDAYNRGVADADSVWPDYNHSSDEAVVRRCNVEYSRHNTAHWACHENYFMRHHSSREGYHTPGFRDRWNVGYLDHILNPHLISRVLYTGAGGLNLDSGGKAFSLSPRMMRHSGVHLWGVKHGGRGGFRLHVICGETNQSELSNYLKMGTTALICLVIQSGRFRIQDIQALRALLGIRIRESKTGTTGVQGMHLAQCNLAMELESVPEVNFAGTNNLRIQYFYLEQVKRCIKAGGMPYWADELVEKWETTLNELRTDISLVTDKLDWAIKYNVFDSYLQEEYQTELNQVSTGLPERAYAELAEMDLLFGQLDEKGIFNILSEHLDHKVISEAYMADAKTRGPYNSRAFIRAQTIQQTEHSLRDNLVMSREWGSIHMGNRHALTLANCLSVTPTRDGGAQLRANRITLKENLINGSSL